MDAGFSKITDSKIIFTEGHEESEGVCVDDPQQSGKLHCMARGVFVF